MALLPLTKVVPGAIFAVQRIAESVECCILTRETRVRLTAVAVCGVEQATHAQFLRFTQPMDYD